MTQENKQLHFSFIDEATVVCEECAQVITSVHEEYETCKECGKIKE